MPSKMSLFNKEIIAQIGRSTGWLSLLYFLGLLFALPIQIIMTYSDDHLKPFPKVENLFQYHSTFQIIFLVSIPVLIAVFLFRYLHVKSAADLMHSLPLNRGKLYHHYALTGFLLLLLPVLLIAISVLIVHETMDLGLYFTKSDILYWVGITTLLNAIIYSASVFVAMMTGISAVHAVLSYIFLFFPFGITILSFLNLKLLLYGFPSDYLLSEELAKMSPLAYVTAMSRETFDGTTAVIYIGVTILLYFLGLFFYKKRKVEAASEAIAFSNLKAVFKYGAAFCVMLVGGSYFHEVSYTSLGWTIFGYVTGAIVGYFAAEMVLQKSWRVFRQVKGLALFLVAVVLLVAGIKSMGIYEDKVPEQATIKGVIIGDNPSFLQGQNSMVKEFYKSKLMIKERNIEAVRQLHEKIIANKTLNQQNEDRNPYLYVKYALKDGGSVMREYRINKKLYSDYFAAVYNSAEYKKATQPIFQMTPSQVQSITIEPNSPENKRAIIYEPQDVKAAFDALKSDILAETYQENVYYEDRGSAISIDFGKNRHVYLEYKLSDQRLTDWLKSKGLIEKATVSGNDIDHILIAKNNFGDIPNSRSKLKRIESQSDVLHVTDKERINEAYHAASRHSHEYIVFVYYHDKQREPEILYMDEQHAPPFVKNGL